MRDDKDTRSELLPLNLRVERRTLQLIDRAVAEVGGERSRFIVDAACRRADAILDRLLHSAHRLTLRGESMRKNAAPPAVEVDPS